LIVVVILFYFYNFFGLCIWTAGIIHSHSGTDFQDGVLCD